MKIVFATAQRLQGSTNVGRIMPLATELQKKGLTCHILVFNSPLPRQSGGQVSVHYVGTEPFQRTSHDKKRLRGSRLILNMLATALRTGWTALRLRPDVVVISKPLPANVIGVWLYCLLTPNYKLVLDADDFELAANKLSSLRQRAVIHWSERKAAQLADVIIVASPFLADHFKQLTQNSKRVEVITTGIVATPLDDGAGLQQNLRPLLAYLGSVSVSSGHRVDLLPEILEKVLVHYPQTHLLIAGEGDDVENLRKEFTRRHLAQHVTWHGRFTLAQVKGLLAPSTIILDPVDDSIANRAKSSFRVMLAGILGLPVVTSNIGIRPELLPRQFHNRLFADPAQADSYADTIHALIEQPPIAADRQQLHDHAAAYSWKKLGERYYEIIVKQ